ncbi:hypothetical protein [Weissella confusa]|uniref:hypothetical protein n=1 Tax=Weissella confusa TaxID=1583 RepID=UPI00223B50FB|nr:hypothetical protein [Weissella confusa]
MIKHSTAQHSTAQHSTAQHSTAQRLDKAFLTVYSEMSGINLNVAFFSVIVRKAVA